MPARARLLGRVVGRISLSIAERFFKRVMRWRVSPEEHSQLIRNLEGVYALYTHIPFCMPPLCRFCCFVRYPYNPSLYREYMRSLREELFWLSSTAENVKIAELYVGGGTPSIDVYALAEYVDSVRSVFGRSVLVSVEANPRDVDDEAVSVLRNAGVSRLSIGVQALDQQRLVMMGRLNNTVRDSLNAVEAARGKFDTLNIDMIWGIASDTPEIVYEEASKALSLGVDQVTFYPLMPAPGLRELERRRREGPWHPLEHKLYEAIINAAIDHGYRPATPWCMDKGSRLIDEYVVDYDHFLALGVSGIGRIGDYMYVNTFNVRKYVKLVAVRGFSAVVGGHVGGVADELYRISTRLFGLHWPPTGSAEQSLLGWLVEKLGGLVLRLAGGGIVDGRIDVRKPGGLYIVHSMQRGLYMAVNMLREWGMKSQI